MVTRNQFLAQLASGGWAIAVGGCGGGGDYNASSPPPPTPSFTCNSTRVTGNHGHSLSIPVSDLNSSVAMSYDIQGTADHAHQVTFSATQIAQLRAGQPVTVTSSASVAHTHELTEACG